MNYLKRGIVIVSIISLFGCHSKSSKDIAINEKQADSTWVNIPTAGNSWVVNELSENTSIIGKEGIQNWTNLNSIIRTYFKTTVSGKVTIYLQAKVNKGSSTIKVTVGNTNKTIEINNNAFANVAIGDFEVVKGYNYIEIQGVAKTGNTIADIKTIMLKGEVTNSKLYYVNEDFYFGRRGPSVHLSYNTPKDKDVVWYYSEINVPKGEDVLGSYYMANGFKDGYFGIQVNSENERRILFSVWSPYDTQNPEDIPDEYKIRLLGKGDGVTTGEFGNEGSGGQSYRVFDWKAGNTYKFLLKGVPTKTNETDYTAYFFTPEDGTWHLIASFRRPKTSRYLQNFYSFLENFRTDTGFISRKANYLNQWVYTTEGEWIELTKAKFTADATARRESRMDYAGGVDENGMFYMKNCGFFNETTAIDSEFTRVANGVAPNIDFSKLEVPIIK